MLLCRLPSRSDSHARSLVLCTVFALLPLHAHAENLGPDAFETFATSRIANVSKPASAKARKRKSKVKQRRKIIISHAPRGALLTTLKKVKPSGLPLSLAVAVINVESRWRVNARGAAGERGLMQLKPATARLMGVKGNLFNPRTNLRAGTRYLHYCYRRAKGNVAATIGCYNLGPGRMWAWNKNPITRNYVSKVRRYTRR